MGKLGPLQNIVENWGIFLIGAMLGIVGWHFRDHIISWMSYGLTYGGETIPMPPNG